PERPRNLKAPGNTEMRTTVGRQWRDVAVAKHHDALARPQCAGNAIDQRRLSGTVRSDQTEAFALADLDIDVVERDEAAKGLGQGLDPKQRSLIGRSHVRFLRKGIRCSSPRMPLGAPTTNSTSMQPSTSTLTSEEIVTARSCCVTPSRIAPSTGPIQC